MIRLRLACVVFSLFPVFIACMPVEDAGPRKVEVLFLGHESRHPDAQTYASAIAAAFGTNGISISYTNDPSALDPETLHHYDVVLVYANHDSITAAQEGALLDFVASGKGFVPVHSASFCFRNSDAFVRLVGAQFQGHGVGTFTARAVCHDHAAMQAVEEFETWDET